jgi:hypothetical protein
MRFGLFVVIGIAELQRDIQDICTCRLLCRSCCERLRPRSAAAQSWSGTCTAQIHPARSGAAAALQNNILQNFLQH